jgi:hypothetical protein
MLYHAMPIALIRISRSRSPANLPNPSAHICLSCHVHPSTHHVQPSPSNHPNASHLSLYSQIPHPLILIEIRKDIRTINKTKENPHRKPLQPRINLLNNILPRPSRPLATSLRHSRRQLDLLDLVRVRDRVDVQAAGHVPGYVAVES